MNPAEALEAILDLIEDDTSPVMPVDTIDTIQQLANDALYGEKLDGDVVMAHGGRTNADLIEGCHRLGYIRDGDEVLDCTWGNGRFWKRYRPPHLTASDLNPDKSPIGYPVDFTKMPFKDGWFDVVVFDGPYQLNGTSTGEGPSAKDADYGVDDEYTSALARNRLLMDGMTDCVRVLRNAQRVKVDRGRWEARGGILLVKCQDQVNAGDVVWQERLLTDHAEKRCGLVKIDEFGLPGSRAQPPRDRKHGWCHGTGRLGCGGPCPDCDGTGRVPSVQEHAARNYSTLLVFRKPATAASLSGQSSLDL